MRKVIELNIQQKANPISLTLVESLDSEEKEFVDSEAIGIEEEVDTKFVSDKTQKVTEETIKKPRIGTEQKNNVDKKTLSFKDLAIKESEIGSPAESKVSPNDKNTSEGKESDSLVGESDSLSISENIRESDKTSLNTIQIKYASFYRRMKQQVENSWVPQINNLNNNFVTGEYETKVLLKINEQGEIIGLKLDYSSGEPELDTIGLKTFKKIRIFQNPPSEVFNGKKYFYLTWSLKLKIGR